MSLKCSHTESSNCCILLYESIRSSRIFSYSYLRTCECPGKVREPLADEFLRRERGNY